MKSLRGARHPLTSQPTPTTPTNTDPHLDLATKSNDVPHLRKMVLGKLRFTEAESKCVLAAMLAVPPSLTPLRRPGKYIALDCEMVQVTRDTEPHSSLARVSVVNFYGAVLLDDFVRQEEFVTDYVTHISGVRPSDLKSDSGAFLLFVLTGVLADYVVGSSGVQGRAAGRRRTAGRPGLDRTRPSERPQGMLIRVATLSVANL